MTDTRIRLLREEDWPDVIAAEERAYAASGLSEGGEALRSRHRASPSTCFVLEDADGFAGYLLALPYPLFRCPDLSLASSEASSEGSSERSSERSSEGPVRSGNLHAHDLVIAERARGRGLAPSMLRHLEEIGRAAGFRTLSLVAVRGSEVLWSQLGYRARPEIGLPASYGAAAVYMAKPLDRAPNPADPIPGSAPRAEVG